jgi:hypothetical protein
MPMAHKGPNRNTYGNNNYNSPMNNVYSQPKSNRDDELLSPHFNNSNYIKYNREEEVRQETNQNNHNYMNRDNQYLPFTIQNEEFVKPASLVNYKNSLENQEPDLNESGDGLSSYAPSERTKSKIKINLFYLNALKF